MSTDNHKYKKYLLTNPETRWARDDEIKKAGTRIDLNADSYETGGIPLMADVNEAYVDGKDTHTLIWGATGSKKTRLFCLPMINIFVKAGESFVVTDPKGEIYARTSGFAEKAGYDTIVLNFRDPSHSDMWNPFSLPYKLYHSGNPDDKDRAVSMVNDFVAMINEKQETRSADAFWPSMTRAYLSASASFLLECGTEDECNLASLVQFCNQGNATYMKNLVYEMNDSNMAAVNFKSVYSLPEKTLDSVLGSCFSVLSYYNSQESLTSMISNNTVDLQNVGRKKTAVYLIIPDEKTTLHFLASAFIKQAYEILISEAQKEEKLSLPVRVNFVLDEFCNMPKIPDMPSMISAARSRNIRYYLVAQSAQQLSSKYGEDADTIKGNCDNVYFLTSKERPLLNELSELCGYVTMPNGNHRSLISPSELQRLSKEKGEALVMHGRNYPYIAAFPDIDDYGAFKRLPPKVLGECGRKGYSVLDFERMHTKYTIIGLPPAFAKEKRASASREEDDDDASAIW